MAHCSRYKLGHLQVDARQQLVEEQRRHEQIKAEAAAALEQRRERLAAKLAAEDAQLKQELLDLQVCQALASTLYASEQVASCLAHCIQLTALSHGYARTPLRCALGL